jgi:hypothetical protein
MRYDYTVIVTNTKHQPMQRLESLLGLLQRH